MIQVKVRSPAALQEMQRNFGAATCASTEKMLRPMNMTVKNRFK